jgi:hypothetical protein
MSTEDKYMKKLWKQEKEERWDLYRQFRQSFADYQERMGDNPKGNYYHPIPDDTGLGGTIVVDHNNRGHESYVYLSTFSGEEIRPGVSVHSMRSFAIGKIHYAMRWRFSTARIYNEGDPVNQFSSTSIQEGPTSNFGRRLLFGGHQSDREWNDRTYRYMSFEPELQWHPEPGEQIEVRGVLRQAIGEVMMLGYDNDMASMSTEVRNLHGIR